jgi:hypothetical protein
MATTQWDELTGTQQALILTGISVELALTATAIVDLARRPRELVRGPKALWALGLVIQPVGPVAYLLFGHRRAAADAAASAGVEG